MANLSISETSKKLGSLRQRRSEVVNVTTRTIGANQALFRRSVQLNSDFAASQRASNDRIRQLRQSYASATENVLNQETLQFLVDHSNIDAPTVTSIFAGFELARASRAERGREILDAAIAEEASNQQVNEFVLGNAQQGIDNQIAVNNRLNDTQVASINQGIDDARRDTNTLLDERQRNISNNRADRQLDAAATQRGIANDRADRQLTNQERNTTDLIEDRRLRREQSQASRFNQLFDSVNADDSSFNDRFNAANDVTDASNGEVPAFRPEDLIVNPVQNNAVENIPTTVDDTATTIDDDSVSDAAIRSNRDGLIASLLNSPDQFQEVTPNLEAALTSLTEPTEQESRLLGAVRGFNSSVQGGDPQGTIDQVRTIVENEAFKLTPEFEAEQQAIADQREIDASQNNRQAAIDTELANIQGLDQLIENPVENEGTDTNFLELRNRTVQRLLDLGLTQEEIDEGVRG